MINLITHVSRQQKRTICCIITRKYIAAATSSARVFSLVRLAADYLCLNETFYMHRLFGYEL